MAQAYVSAKKFNQIRDVLIEETGIETAETISQRIASILNYYPEKYNKELAARRQAHVKARQKQKAEAGTTYSDAHRKYYQKHKTDIRLKRGNAQSPLASESLGASIHK